MRQKEREKEQERQIAFHHFRLSDEQTLKKRERKQPRHDEFGVTRTYTHSTAQHSTAQHTHTHTQRR
jgi:hypothetical protein